MNTFTENVIFTVKSLLFPFLATLNNASEGETDARRLHPLPHWEAVIPVGVSGRVHEKKAPMGQFQLDRLYMMFLRLLASVSMPEHQIAYGSERHGGDGARRVQFALVVPVLPDVILTVFIPADTHNISDISVKNKQTQCMWPCDRYRDRDTEIQLSGAGRNANLQMEIFDTLLEFGPTSVHRTKRRLTLKTLKHLLIENEHRECNCNCCL